MPGQLIFNFRVFRITIPEISPICLVFTSLGMKYQWAKKIIIVFRGEIALGLGELNSSPYTLWDSNVTSSYTPVVQHNTLCDNYAIKRSCWRECDEAVCC